LPDFLERTLKKENPSPALLAEAKKGRPEDLPL
jgi:hypothetical protein